jgi:hypothetical protein
MTDHDCCAHETSQDSPLFKWAKTYRPLLLIFGYLVAALAAASVAAGAFDLARAMSLFMGGFFLVFSFFKLLDLKGFADAYATYDLLARRSRAYALAYPFLEFALGLAYVSSWNPRAANLATFFLMAFSSLGVIRALLRKEKIRCACLGTVFELPMTTVTLVEDALMALMAAVTLATGGHLE